MWTAVMTLLLALATFQAIGKARRRRWYEAAASFPGVLGGYLMTVGTIRWHVEPLFWTGAVLVPVGFGLEYLAWRARRQPTRGWPGSSDRPEGSGA